MTTQVKKKILQNLYTPAPGSKLNNPEYLWSIETMAAVIAAKKESRNRKGQTMNCFVLKRDQRGKADELDTFLDQLKINVNALEGIRFQLACQQGKHWYPVDIRVKNGRIQAIIMEAAFTPSTPGTLCKIKERFPDADVFAFLPDEVDIAGEPKPRMLQTDGDSCSRFTLEHIFHMQTKDMFEILEKNKAKFTPPPILPPSTNFRNLSMQDIRLVDNYDYYHMTPANLPPETAFLFRDTQSLSILNSLSDAVKNEVVNSKGETLLESVASHTQQVDVGQGKIVNRNRAIADFRERKTRETEDFIAKKSDSDMNKILANRNGINFLTSKAYRHNDRKEQQALAQTYTAVLKTETDKTKTQVSHYAREVKSLLEDVKLKNPKSDVLRNHIDHILAIVEKIRIAAMQIKGGTFFKVEKQLKAIVKELAIINSELNQVQQHYANEINQDDIKILSKKFNIIRDSLANFHAAEVKNEKMSDYINIKVDTVHNLFKSKNENASPKITSSFVTQQQKAPSLTIIKPEIKSDIEQQNQIEKK